MTRRGRGTATYDEEGFRGGRGGRVEGGRSNRGRIAGRDRARDEDAWPRSEEPEVRHAHRTARVIEVVGTSTRGFEDAVANALEDCSRSLRGIRGAEVLGMSVSCEDGRIVLYKADLKVAFGVERTPPA
ncbi:MAG TPA: dodecin family protein [Candidatus Thermoplasmatota archaeon]|nr:dodecin family protein [Candidatus Thermoplasmatota archaeon]